MHVSEIGDSGVRVATAVHALGPRSQASGVIGLNVGFMHHQAALSPLNQPKGWTDIITRYTVQHFRTLF